MRYRAFSYKDVILNGLVMARIVKSLKISGLRKAVSSKRGGCLPEKIIADALTLSRGIGD
jgi:hypothetical protein